MLRGLHKASSTWLGKAVMAAVMGVLVVSFAIWGIGDIFRGFGLNSVAKIGGTEISIEQFRQFYNDRLQQLSRSIGRPITPEQARALGFDRRLIGQLVAETALDERAHQLNLGISDAEIAQRITDDPNFRGLSGQFDRNRFEQLIRQGNYSEQRYVEEQRRVMLRRQVAQSITGDVTVPKVALSAFNQYQNEKRSIDFVTFGIAQAGDIPAPTPEELTKYFDDRKVLFRAPEYRKVTLLSVMPASLAHPEAVNDADAKAYYEQHIGNYGAPEQREVRQIVFPNDVDAAAAADRIAKGASFDDIVKERGLKESDTDLGMVAKASIIDPAIADAAFALKPGTVSAPVKGTFGTVLVMVNKIEPSQQKSFEQMTPSVKQEIAENRARSAIGSLRDKIEDERAAGSTLVETAKKLGLTSRTIDQIDRSGRGPDGQPIADLPKQPDVVASAFSSDVGVDNDALQLPGGGYLWYDVTGITRSRERTLDEVKDQVTAHWREDEIAKRLQAKSDDMVGKLNGGAKLAQLASEAGLKVETAFGLQRGKPTPQMPAKALDDIFRTAKDAAGSAEGSIATSRTVFVVSAVDDPTLDPDSAAAKTLTTNLQTSYSDDLLGAYIAQLEAQLGVTINEAALNQITGGATPGQ
jgi:peptidyl-prolyl cis-trans isomerase D